eukprot:CAMPEP_0176358330 /NCGR_PEP_ID=MMETSP0126-20121128/15479_1 /TAXON_ID=141414 ORGANISM="Strombidinopsis acuminatum, Strain SPMC142" /NCGR_SAMPLE_ID=MMETSP0126 /ASSEMBLY_ACC=CAM_ASM_000229 /LENGTH=84 /DNA_ID=CAMNT_0017712457 /DNA_START=748 /DNA_END=1002 /DNA_ORIENTATION=-
MTKVGKLNATYNNGFNNNTTRVDRSRSPSNIYNTNDASSQNGNLKGRRNSSGGANKYAKIKKKGLKSPRKVRPVEKLSKIEGLN